MKMQLKKIPAAILSSLLLTAPVFAAQGNGNGMGYGMGYNANLTQDPIQQTLQSNNCLLTPDPSVQVSTLEQADLQFMAEEEKLARDVYVYLNNLWHINVFANIINAEQKHMDSVKTFLDAYQLTDLSIPAYGQFTNVDLQNLYDTLIAQGSLSVVDALMVGALIEEVDIADLITAIEKTSDQAVIQMYTNLMNGSYSHLRAFVNQLRNFGVTSYSAQKLSQQQVDEILSSAMNADPAMNMAMARDVNGFAISSDSCFINNVAVNGSSTTLTNSFTGNDELAISSTILANTQDVGQNVNMVAVVAYTAANGETSTFMKNNNAWENWDGNIYSLNHDQAMTLQKQQSYEVFKGQLGQLYGDYVLSIGYKKADGTVVYNGAPVRFSVK